MRQKVKVYVILTENRVKQFSEEKESLLRTLGALLVLDLLAFVCGIVNLLQ